MYNRKVNDTKDTVIRQMPGGGGGIGTLGID